MTQTGRSLTVGSLLGLPAGAVGTGVPVPPTAPPAPAAEPPPATSGPYAPPPTSGEMEGPGWKVVGGEADTGGGLPAFRSDAVEALTYNNPFNQVMERVWFDHKLVFAVDLGAVDVDAERVQVAQEYQIVYAVELDERGKHRGEPELVPGQYNIYDSVPGMANYSPIWQFNYVIVPRSYEPNTLRSEGDCLASGYPILKSQDFEN